MAPRPPPRVCPACRRAARHAPRTPKSPVALLDQAARLSRRRTEAALRRTARSAQKMPPAGGERTTEAKRHAALGPSRTGSTGATKGAAPPPQIAQVATAKDVANHPCDGLRPRCLYLSIAAELVIRRLQLLQAHNIRLRLVQPAQQPLQATPVRSNAGLRRPAPGPRYGSDVLNASRSRPPQAIRTTVTPQSARKLRSVQQALLWRRPRIHGTCRGNRDDSATAPLATARYSRGRPACPPASGDSRPLADRHQAVFFPRPPPNSTRGRKCCCESTSTSGIVRPPSLRQMPTERSSTAKGRFARAQRATVAFAGWDCLQSALRTLKRWHQPARSGTAVCC